MTSAELIALKRKYIAFRNSLTEIIDETNKLKGQIEPIGDNLLEYYSINNNSADNNYLKKTNSSIDEIISNLNYTLKEINKAIRNLDIKIERARDRELAALF